MLLVSAAPSIISTQENCVQIWKARIYEIHVCFNDDSQLFQVEERGSKPNKRYFLKRIFVEGAHKS